MTIQSPFIKKTYDPSMFTSDQIKTDITRLNTEHEIILARYQKQIDDVTNKGESWKTPEIIKNAQHHQDAYDASLTRNNERLAMAIENEKLKPIPNNEYTFDGRHKELARKSWIRNGGTAEDFESNWPQLKNKLLIELTAISMRSNIQPDESTIKKL